MRKKKESLGQKISGQKPETRKCWNCGRPRHLKKDCPAANAKCNICRKLGHYAKCCRQSGVRGVSTHDTDEEDAFIGAITTEKKGKHQWTAEVIIAGQNIQVHADMQADVSIIPEKTYHKALSRIRLNKPERTLYGADNQKLSRVIGYFKSSVQYREKKVLAEIYVVKGAEKPLLAGDVSKALGIVRKADINAIRSNRMSFDPMKKFQGLFRDLGHVRIPYTIRLTEDSVPYALTTLRRIPLPLLEKIKRKLDSMVEMDVIVRVDEPTEWCSGLVTVPKPNGDIRMCVDYVQLNKYIRREIYPMPVTENILGQLGQTRYFSKLDANSGFWQFDLDEKSQNLTSFITPFGRFKYKRLPFGISAAPEFFQKHVTKIVEGINGVPVNSDDILVYGESTEEHDQRLLKVLQKLLAAGITLNKDKCIFGVTEVKYLGHVINEEGVHIDKDRIDAIASMSSPVNVSEVRSLMGTINYMARFIPHLAAKVKPLNDLLSLQSHFRWGEDQEQAFNLIKKELTRSPALAFFSPDKETVIAADASSYGV